MSREKPLPTVDGDNSRILGQADAVLFDWDGTLIDSGALLLQCWHQVTTSILGAPFPVTEPDRVRFLSMRGADSFPLLSDDPDVVRALEDGFTEAYASLAASTVRPHPGAARLLDGLRARGVKVAVVTSKTASRMEIDRQVCGLGDRIDHVVTGDDVARGKPDPEGVLTALTALGVAPGRAVMVGDGPVDVRAGHAAGTITIGVTQGLHSETELRTAHPDHLVGSLREVADLLLGP